MTLDTETMTFFFTDVVGSTALWEQYPQEMRVAMHRHDALVEGVVESHGGQVVRPRGEGDSRFAVFVRASDAVAAACALQQALAVEPWSLPVPLRVRLALHTGKADVRAGDYYGSDVNRCARLRSLAHPGQTLLSLATAQLARDSLPIGVSLQDLGLHRLKDLTQPEQVFQLIVPGLEADFPPLRSLDARPNNLPILPTSLIGREEELATVTQLLRREDVRLVTVTGPGGMGKTRLSLQAGAELLDDFPDGVFFVDLAPINDPAFVATTIAETLQVPESATQPLLETLKTHLWNQHSLLLLDNFEQVMEAAPLVAELLGACRGLKALATSREALHLRGEHLLPLPPLAPPSTQEEGAAGEEVVSALSDYAAVELFVQRAQAAQPAFTLTPENAPLVAAICRHLDGLPLAIELAAARVRLFSPQALLARLTSATDSPLHLLRGGARDLPMRQQTLRTAIAWSYDLLDPSEQGLFRRLAVFVGGFTLEAVEAICDPAELALDVLDGLTSLLDKSLLQQTEQPDGEPRFVLLRTIQEYARERLEASGEAAAIRAAHAAFYLALVEEAARYVEDRPSTVWMEQLDADKDNVRAALEWFLAGGDAESGLRLADALWQFWWVRGYLSEGRDWLHMALARTAQTEATAVRARVLSKAGMLALMQADYAVARALFAESAALAHKLQDKRSLAKALSGLGMTAEWAEGDYEQARALQEESVILYREIEDREGLAYALNNLAGATLGLGDIAGARTLFEESLTIFRELGKNPLPLLGLGAIAWQQADYAAARGYYMESLM
ncbi:MAG: tetratricopeptide repeat protein, partial [Chloroflexota bacterium]|nr:tetratricopeptide repeat protein [Chloroflexota bacterium]